jgi:hypothetical protein
MSVPQGDAVLLEPLPALLSCVQRLTSSAQQARLAGATRGPGSLGGSENWMGLDEGDEDDQQECSMTGTLKVSWAGMCSWGSSADLAGSLAECSQSRSQPELVMLWYRWHASRLGLSRSMHVTRLSDLPADLVASCHCPLSCRPALTAYEYA